MELLKQIIKNTQDGIVVCDCRFNFLEWNTAMERITGLKNSEVIGKCALNKFPILKEKGLDRMMMRVLEGESVNVENFSYHYPADSEEKWFRLLFVPRYEDNCISGIIGFIKDITVGPEQNEEHLLLADELKEMSATCFLTNRQPKEVNERHRLINEELRMAKEKAEESNRLKTAFLENISHEIRTPMNAIIGFSQLLDDRMDETDPKKEFTRLITQQSFELLNTIDQILEMSSIELGQVNLRAEAVCILSMFDDLFNYFEKYKNRRGKDNILFSVRGRSYVDEGILFTDRFKLRQIFKYLLDNAFKFTERGAIEFGIFDIEDDYVTFFVSDTGVGIPDNQYDTVFEKFRQLVPERRSREGLGLGLSIAKGLVKLLGGNICLKSVMNGGTTFYFSV
ncbi:MAG TPA: PAS domain-containing sensor histidine kinase, partial [Bacteroidales bacterium]